MNRRRLTRRIAIAVGVGATTGVLAAAAAAATHGAATDAIYLARADPAVLAAMGEAMLAWLREARLEPGTLYVLRDEAALAAARSGGLEPVRLDGLWVVPSPETLAR